MGGGKEVVKLLVGNKVDQERVIQRDEAEGWAKARGMLFMEASAKTKVGITQVFNEVVQKVNLSYLIIRFVLHYFIIVNFIDSRESYTVIKYPAREAWTRC